MANITDSPTLSPVLITGGCGFIGSHLVEGLLKTEPNAQIHVVDVSVDRNRFPGVTYHACDITLLPGLEAVFLQAKPKTVFHVAGPDPLVLNPSNFRRVTIGGTHNLLVAARKSGTVQAFVFTSTSSVIHDNKSDLIKADETWPVLRYPQQKRVYSLVKVEAQDEVLAANRQNGDSSMLTLAILPVTAFGERDFTCTDKIVATCRAGRAHVQIGSGNNQYDFTYVSNLVDGHILAAKGLLRAWGRPQIPAGERVDGESFIITNDEPILFWDFHRAIAASIGLPVNPEDVKVVPRWLAMLVAGVNEWATWVFSLGRRQARITTEAVHLTTVTRTLSCEKAKRILGYEPKVSMTEGIKKAGNWFVEEASSKAKKD